MDGIEAIVAVLVAVVLAPVLIAAKLLELLLEALGVLASAGGRRPRRRSGR